MAQVPTATFTMKSAATMIEIRKNTNVTIVLKSQFLFMLSIFSVSNLQQTFFLPTFILAEYFWWQIQHEGISTFSAAQIFLVIQSKMQSSWTQAMLPEQSHTEIRGFIKSQQILHLNYSSSGAKMIFYCSKVIVCPSLSIIKILIALLIICDLI